MTEGTTTPVETIRKALKGYRVMAWVTGISLIALCAEMVLKHILKVDWPYLWLVPTIHGWVYIAYLIVTANLALKVRWPIPKFVGVYSQAPFRWSASSSSTFKPRNSLSATTSRRPQVRCSEQLFGQSLAAILL